MSGVPIYHTGIAPDWIDYNGHLRDAYYGLIISYATDALMERIGLDTPYRKLTGCTLYTLEMHIHYLREVKGSDAVKVAVRILGADRKRIHAAFDLSVQAGTDLVATAEVMLLHVQQAPPAASKPFPDAIGSAIAALAQAGVDAAASEAGSAPESRRMQLPQR
jgi:acyl-CoA thioesterase FadM